MDDIDLVTMTEKELRKIATDRAIGSPVWRVRAGKSELIAAIGSGIVSTTATVETVSPVAPASEKTVPPSQNTDSGSDLARMLAFAIQEHIKPQSAPMDKGAIVDLIREELQNIPPSKLEISVNGIVTGTIKAKQHFQFGTLLKVLSARKASGDRVNVWLAGPAGSGKTSAAKAVADSLGLSFYPQSVCRQTSKSDMMGHINPNGDYVRSPLRDKYEHGGVYLLDEADAGNENTTLCLNAAADNGVCGFPDGVVKRHKDFILIACANTTGSGASREYVGRNQMDGAFMDRFVKLPWNYDEVLESSICGNSDFASNVQKLRARAASLKLRVIISPRASISGSALVAAGFTDDEALQMTVFEGLDVDTVGKLKGGA